MVYTAVYSMEPFGLYSSVNYGIIWVIQQYIVWSYEEYVVQYGMCTRLYKVYSVQHSAQTRLVENI